MTAALQVTQIHCPECNAILQVTAGATAVTCSYCGASSQVQRPRPSPRRPPRPMAGNRPRAARQAPRRKTRTILLVGVPLALAIAAILAVAVSPVAVIPFGIVAFVAGATRIIFNEAVSWSGNEPVLVADADGVAIAIGLVRYVLAGDTMHVAAYRCDNGRRQWETESLGKYLEVYQSKLALVRDAIVRTDPRGLVECRDVKTGALRWQRSIDEVASRVCEGATADDLAIQSANHAWTTFSLRDGSPRPTSTAPPIAAAPKLPEISGMLARRVLAPGDGLAIALGYRTPGTLVPMIVALDASGAVRWKSDVPASDPLTAEGDVDHYAIDDREIAVIYKRVFDTILTMFDRTTGARRFEVTVGADNVTALAFAADAVLVSCWGNLKAFERATGRARFLVGSK